MRIYSDAVITVRTGNIDQLTLNSTTSLVCDRATCDNDIPTPAGNVNHLKYNAS